MAGSAGKLACALDDASRRDLVGEQRIRPAEFGSEAGRLGAYVLLRHAQAFKY